MTIESKKQFYKELIAFAIPLALLGCFVFNWSVITVYIVMCLDEIIKVPFIPRRYKKYLWVKNLTTKEA